MSVLVEGISVIVRVATLEEKHPDGLLGFRLDCRNRTFCSDGTLARVGFMAPADAQAFVARLESLGLVFERDGRFVDIAVFDQQTGPTGLCEDLVFGRTEQGVAYCAAAGEEGSELVTPRGWTYEGSLSSGHQFIPNEEVADRLRYLRSEGDLDVYLYVETGQEVYVGRAWGMADPSANADQLFRRGIEIAQPHLFFGDYPYTPPDSEGRARIEKGMQNLELVLRLKPTHWPALWYMGKCHQALGQTERSYEFFKAASDLVTTQPDVYRELMFACMELGRSEESLTAARAALAASPSDPGLRANLALALLLAARLDEAQSTAEEALAQAPDDSLTRDLLDTILRVRRGEMPQPHRMSDLS